VRSKTQNAAFFAFPLAGTPTAAFEAPGFPPAVSNSDAAYFALDVPTCYRCFVSIGIFGVGMWDFALIKQPFGSAGFLIGFAIAFIDSCVLLQEGLFSPRLLEVHVTAALLDCQ